MADYYTKRNIKPGLPQEKIRSSIMKEFSGSNEFIPANKAVDGYFIGRLAQF